MNQLNHQVTTIRRLATRLQATLVGAAVGWGCVSAGWTQPPSPLPSGGYPGQGWAPSPATGYPQSPPAYGSTAAPAAAPQPGGIQPVAYQSPMGPRAPAGYAPAAQPSPYNQSGYYPGSLPPQYAPPQQGGMPPGGYAPVQYAAPAAYAPAPGYAPAGYGTIQPTAYPPAGYPLPGGGAMPMMNAPSGPSPGPGGFVPQGSYGPPGAYGVPPQSPYSLPSQVGPAPVNTVAQKVPEVDDAPAPVQQKVDSFIADIIDAEVRLTLKTGKGTLIRTKQPVARVSISDPSIVETVQFRADEFELVGRALGETTLTLWFNGTNEKGLHPYIRYLIRVVPSEERDEVPAVEYGKLQRRINEMFPNSHVQLIPVLDKLVVRGQARDAREAAQIMSLLRGEMVDQFGGTIGPGSWNGIGGFGVGGGAAFGNYGANLGGVGRFGRLWGAGDLPATSVVNMLDVPGEQQVMLKVRVAELTRTALREMGANFTGVAGDFTFSSVLNVPGAATAVLTSEQVQFAISALSSNRTSKMLAEPNLVTLNGYPASFIAGGQFAVPTVVGVGGAAAATTGFQGYGTQIQFTPSIIDKDHIRLQVTPTVSRLDSAASVNGIFGLNTRSVATTVDLREGQWLAIAGLIQDQQVGEKARVPWLGDIPLIDMIFSRKRIERQETEVVILVSPELVHPMEADQVPQILPGMEVTEPDDAAFYFRGRYEGHPDHHHRSTVWPVYRFDVFDARNRAIRDSKASRRYMTTEGYYMHGAHGFSN